MRDICGNNITPITISDFATNCKKYTKKKKEADSNITHLTSNMPIIQGMDLSIHHWRVDQFMQAMVTQRTILGVRFINRSRKIFSPTEIHFCHKRSLPTKPKRSVRLRHLKKKCNTLSFWLSGLNFQRLHGMTRELEVHTHRPLTSFLSLSLSLKCNSSMLHLHHISLF